MVERTKHLYLFIIRRSLGVFLTCYGNVFDFPWVKNKIAWIRNSNLHKEMENIRKGINEGKMEYCIFLFRILKQHCLLTSVVSDSVRPHRRQPTRLPCPWDSPGKNTGLGYHFRLQCMKVKAKSEESDMTERLHF